MAGDAAEAALFLRRDFVGESLDIAMAHFAWASKHLADAHDIQAIASFSKGVLAIKAASPVLRELQAEAVARAAIGTEAAEYRASRRLPAGAVP